MSLPWVERYRPQNRDELVGNETAINGLRLFLRRWSEDAKIKAAVLIGPAGCGKTSAVYALANEMGYDVTEVNASDTRKKKSIQDVLAPATRFTSIVDTTKDRIILMDEIDGLSGRYDRGGLSEFFKIVKTSKYPIIGTANDPESNNIQKIARQKSIRIYEFTRLDEFQIFELLLRIAEKEDLDVDDIILEQIAASVSGDIRAAINELESHLSGTSEVQLEERNKMKTLVDLFNELFRAKDYNTARKVFSNAPSDYYKILLYLFDETADQCRTPKQLATAYEQLAQADLVYNRIMRTQNWSLLKYFFDFIGPGLALSRDSTYYKRITKLPDIPSAFMARGKAKSILSKANMVAPKVATKLHISEHEFVHKQYKFFEQIILGDSGGEIAAWLDLSDEEVQKLTKRHQNSDLAKNIEEARVKVGKIRVSQGRRTHSSLSGLDKFFKEHKKSDKPEEDVKEEQTEEIEEEQEGQLSLDEFF